MLTCKGTGGGGERPADAARLTVPAVTSSGFGVADSAHLHPFGPVGCQTPIFKKKKKKPANKKQLMCTLGVGDVTILCPQSNFHANCRGDGPPASDLCYATIPME